MLNPFARALAYYVGGGFALALLCAAFVADPDENDARPERARRRAAILVPLGLAHPVFALAAFVLTRDLRRAGSAVPVLLPSAATSLAISLGVMVVVFAATS